MLSQAQLGANRMNSQKVHRPHFPEGKAASSLNAQNAASRHPPRKLDDLLNNWLCSANLLCLLETARVSNENHQSSSNAESMETECRAQPRQSLPAPSPRHWCTLNDRMRAHHRFLLLTLLARSEERRVGKECRS